MSLKTSQTNDRRLSSYNETLPELKIVANCDDYFYLLINYEFTEEQKKQIKQSKLTEKEKAILINHTEEDNPIIIKIKT